MAIDLSAVRHQGRAGPDIGTNLFRQRARMAEATGAQVVPKTRRPPGHAFSQVIVADIWQRFNQQARKGMQGRREDIRAI